MHYREVHGTETAYSGHSDNVDSLATHHTSILIQKVFYIPDIRISMQAA